MKLPRRNFLHLAAGAAALPAVSGVAWAQAYPSRPVRIIVPFPAAGPSDVLARLYGQKLSQRWYQPVVVENRVGATGTIGTEVVVRAPPDGYTLLFTADLPITMAPALLKLRYDPQRDLAPIAALAKNDALLVVHPSTGIRSLADLVAAAKAQPGALTFASAGGRYRQMDGFVQVGRRQGGMKSRALLIQAMMQCGEAVINALQQAETSGRQFLGFHSRIANYHGFEGSK